MFNNKKSHSGNTHMIIGLATVVVLYILNQNYKFIELTLTTQDIIISLIIAAFFSRLPDQDIEGSTINDIVTVGLLGVIIWAFTTGNKTIGIVTALYLVVLQVIGHRGIFHSFGMALIMSAPLYFIKPLFFWIGVISYSGHLISEKEFNLWNEGEWFKK